MKCYSYQALFSSPLGCRGESLAIQDNIFKCSTYWAFQQSTAIFIVSELLLLRDSLPVFSDLSQFLPVRWRSAPTPALSTCTSATRRLSLILGPPGRAEACGQSSQSGAELLRQDYLKPRVPVTPLPVPCTLSQGDTLPRLPASSTTMPVLLLRYKALPPSVPQGWLA